MLREDDLFHFWVEEKPDLMFMVLNPAQYNRRWSNPHLILKKKKKTVFLYKVAFCHWGLLLDRSLCLHFSHFDVFWSIWCRFSTIVWPNLAQASSVRCFITKYFGLLELQNKPKSSPHPPPALTTGKCYLICMLDTFSNTWQQCWGHVRVGMEDLEWREKLTCRPAPVVASPSVCCFGLLACVHFISLVCIPLFKVAQFISFVEEMRLR